MEDLRALVGRCIMAGMVGTTLTEVTPLLDAVQPGAVLLFDRNIESADQVRRLCSAVHRHAMERGWGPVLIAVDQEGGVVQRLTEPVATEWPSAMCLGAAGDTRLTQQCAAALGRDLRVLGIDWNLAPCVDVNNNPANPIILTRSFSADPTCVAEHGVATHRGFAEAGMVDCAKHFPGHGDTTVDSHLGLPVLVHALDRLRAVELPPFQACCAAGVDSVMVAHLLLPALDAEFPASLSSQAIDRLLRGDLGYDGVVLTDALGMAAVAERWPPSEAAVRALHAGADMVIAETPDLARAARDGMLDGVAAGSLAAARVREAAERVARLADSIIATGRDKPAPDLAALRDAHRALAREAAAAGATWLRGEPVAREGPGVLVTFRDLPRTPPSRTETLTTHLAEDIARLRPGSVTVRVSLDPTPPECAQVTRLVSDAMWVAVTTLDGHRHQGQSRLLDALHSVADRLWVVALGHPGDPDRWPWVPNALALYSWRVPTLEVLPRLLFGELSAPGSNPLSG